MTEGKLVYTLQVENHHPSFDTFYGREMGRPPGPVCLIKPNGEVRMFESGTIFDVKDILAHSPYYVTVEELSKVYVREE